MPWIFSIPEMWMDIVLFLRDSDFTRLAARLRESGMLVLGMGEEKTPQTVYFRM